MFYVMFLGYVCVATLCGVVLLVVIFVTIFRQRRQQDLHAVVDHLVTLPVVHALLAAAWVLGLLTARHGGQQLNVAFCVLNACLGLAILVRCMFDFRLRSLCADLTVDGLQNDRRRRRASQDTWSHTSSPAAVGRTAASLTRDDSRDVFAGNSIITPAPQNGTSWRRVRRGDLDRLQASMKYGKPEVHCADALQDAQNDVRTKPEVHSEVHCADRLQDAQNDVRTGGRVEAEVTQSSDVTGQIGNNVATTGDNMNNESLTYI